MARQTTSARWHGRGMLAWLLACVLLVWCAGCSGEPGEASADGGAEAEADANAMRLVTLAPSLTQMVVDLELGDRLVGVAEHDRAAPPDLPVVGNYADVNTEQLIRLRPTHVLTLTTAREPPRRLRELAEAGRFELVAYPFPFAVDDVRQTLHGAAKDDADDADRPPPLGEVLDVPERARELLERFDARLAHLRDLTADRERPRVLMVIGTGPIMASGPDTVHDELLGWIGGRNAAAEANVTAPTYDREGVLALSPDVILLLSPNAPALRENDARLDDLRGLPIPAIENDRVHLINHPLTLLASTSLPEIAAEMAAAVHPELADDLVE